MILFQIYFSLQSPAFFYPMDTIYREGQEGKATGV